MSFSCFSQLPIELQDLIWEFYIPNSTRTAHFAGLFPMLDAIEKVPSLTRTLAPHMTPAATLAPTYTGFDRATALRTLLQTTSGSRSVSLRHNDALSSTTSLTLREGSSFPLTFPHIPALRINANSDLVILEDSWYKTMKQIPGAPLRDLLSLEPLHYLAILQKPDRLRLADGICRLLLSFEELHVLYLLVYPNLFDSTGEIGAYIEGRGRGGGFWVGEREYFEITPEAQELGGAERAAESYQRSLDFVGDDLDAILERKKGAGRDILRLMTWRDV